GFRIHIVLAILLSFASMAPAQSAADGQALTATLTGSVIDDSGTAIAGATVTWSKEGTSADITATTTADGRFSFAGVPSGPYRLGVSSPGFANQTMSAVLPPGATTQLPPIRLTLVFNTVSVDVTATVEEVAERQIKEQEQQRLFGVMPNYFVVYIHD